MINLPTDSISYTIIFVVFAIFQGSLILVLIYLFVTRVLASRKENLQDDLEEQEAYSKALKILERAKEEALHVLSNSHEKARELLSTTTSFTKKSENELTDEIKRLSASHLSALEKSSQELIEAYQHALSEEKEKGLGEISGTSAEVKKELLHEIDEFKEVLHKETIDVEENVRNEIKKEFEKTRVDLDQYKKDRLERIDHTIYDILGNATKNILGKSMNIDEHQELIRRLLQEAKEEGNFTI